MMFLVGAMPSVASARPNNAALGVCSDAACRVAVINAASLRPSRNGRIGFKPLQKGDRGKWSVWDQSFKEFFFFWVNRF